MRRFANFIDGEWVEHAGATLPVDDPSTGEQIAEVPDSDTTVVDRAVAAARRAFDTGSWRRMSAADRADRLRALARVLETRFDGLVDDLVADSGSTARFAPMMQVGAPLAHLRDFADMAPLLAAPAAYPVQTTPGFGQWELHREPIGVVGAFSPYNFPLFMAVWKVAPALLAGNTVVLKPSPLTPYGPDALARAAAEAGIPPGVLNLVHGDRVAGEALAEHPGVDLLTFTGSSAVGSLVMGAAARGLKDVVLELGGKSPGLVLPDADPELAVRGMLFSSLMHAGQACVALTRMLVPASQRDDYLDLLAERAGAVSLGPAADLATDVGPVISEAARQRVEKLVSAGLEAGGRALVGGTPPVGVPEGGHYVTPTVIVDAAPDNPVVREEVFGPVLVVQTYDDVEHGIRLANDTPYGLAAGVWGGDLQRARQVALRLRGGLTWVNDAAQADVARTPFVGRGRSGVGGELGPEGLFAYTVTRSLYTALDADVGARPYGVVGSEWE
ncbi:aldehyde dehydrogenase family protein [Nocardioides zeae]|uniref:aldehyde dehydrogenase (NAD(+)) n=1 Tax=Nocardioides zeae TaxID=1457234 RepID=A0A6P0HH19_9ACTN|nr:aldehyde dehydrogenase family protein [Nocardioides zeae]NEN77881.1 aldehyde dehydrogenase [Nocardioides zeae]